MIPAVIQPNHTSLIAISTPDDESNYLSQLPDIIDPTTGLPVFTYLQVGLSCTSCQAKQKPCPHKTKHLPAHLSSRRRLIAQAFLSHDELTKTQEM